MKESTRISDIKKKLAKEDISKAVNEFIEGNKDNGKIMLRICSCKKIEISMSCGCKS